MSSAKENRAAVNHRVAFLEAKVASCNANTDVLRTYAEKLTHQVMVKQLAIFMKITKLAADLEAPGKQTMTAFADHHIASIREFCAQVKAGEDELRT